MKIIRKVLPVLGMVLFFSWGSTAGAATITHSWTGTILGVVVDDGTGVYTGTSVGSSFSGAFTYDPSEANILGLDTSDGDSTIEPSDTWVEYLLGSGSGTITDGITQLSAANATHSITNNHPNDEPILSETLSALLGKEVPLGTLHDGWSLHSHVGNVGFSVAYTSLLTDMLGDLSFRPTPPWSPPGSPPDSNNQIVEFYINEGDEGVFFAYGTITTVPLPAAVWLFGSALGLLGWMRRSQKV